MYLLSMYYRRYELQWRFALFFMSLVVAGAFGGVSAAHLDYFPFKPH